MGIPPPPRERKCWTRARGFNLIEAAIVLGVVGLVIGGIWVAAANMRENYRVNKVANGFMVIAQNTMPMLIEFQQMPTPSLAQIESLNLLAGADGFISDGTKILTPIDGLYFDIAGTGPGGVGFRLLGKMTPGECIGLMLKLTAAMQSYKPRLSDENHYTDLGDIMRISLLRNDVNNNVYAHFYQKLSPNNANLSTHCHDPILGGLMMYWYRIKS